MAAAFAAGLALADEVQPSGPTAAAVGFAGVCCLVSAWTRHRKLPDARDGELLPRIAKATAVLLMVGWAAVGFANLGVRAAALAGSYLPELHGRVVVVEGVVGSDPARMGRAWSYSLRKVRTVPQSAAAPGSGERAQSGRLLVRTFGKPPQVALGDRVRTELKISRLDSREPFDAWLARRGIAATGVALSRVERLTSTSNPLLAASNLFRRRMSAASGAAMDQTRAALLMGVVIGDETRIGQDVEQDFRASGLSHLTAVSGANVAMVLAALALLLGAMRIPRRPAVVIGLAVIVLFTLVTRWEPSVLRAAVMASAGLAAFLFGRVPTPGHAFVLAFLGLVAFDPMVLWSAGFQLSFAATAGILWLRPVLAARLKIVPKPLAEAVAIGIAAQVAVFPLIALHFGRISAAAVPANLAAFALVAPITLLGLAGGVLALASSILAWPFFKMAGGLVFLLHGVAKIFGRSDVSQIAVPNFGVAEAVASYLAIAAVWLLLAERRRWARWPALGGAAVFALATVVPALGSTPPSGLRVTFFDVGEGDSALVESPGGARILIDGGRDPELVADTLKRRGFERIDLVVASHLHADHVLGLQEVLRRFSVQLAVHPGVKAPLLPTLTAERSMDVVSDGESIRLGDLTVDVLGPTPSLREVAAVSVSDQARGEGPELNDASVVLRVNWAGECILFTGDVEEAGQEQLLEGNRRSVDCTVMKAPHHGSGRLSAQFVEAADPEWVAVSVGSNTYGHPSAKALSIFQKAGGRVLRTDRLGDVVLEVDDRGAVTSAS